MGGVWMLWVFEIWPPSGCGLCLPPEAPSPGDGLGGGTLSEGGSSAERSYRKMPESVA